MTIDVLKQFEDEPSEYPPTPSGLSVKATELDANMVWARIEAYTAHRFTQREVVWTLLGDGGDEWHPQLTPIVSKQAHIWANDAWEAVKLVDAPLGFCLPSGGTYKITAQVGGGNVPAPVSGAFERLAEYLAGARSSTDEPGASNSKFSVGSTINFEVTRSPAWLARAMQLSGAADLLRPYRRA